MIEDSIVKAFRMAARKARIFSGKAERIGIAHFDLIGLVPTADPHAAAFLVRPRQRQPIRIDLNLQIAFVPRAHLRDVKNTPYPIFHPEHHTAVVLGGNGEILIRLVSVRGGKGLLLP